ncbi:hypothetical protein BDM02DRAFT_3107868 [Thelephora ganbajun]|uniref:Uncharacterized protein n=1 Tax=Thelephora ganbajun TaxID=370292 RepID=A0ACB6ZVZ3_THEGA|nr:hypothetical protein BDM02DRAFT_3107868 [Thelephora ganbajun]
MFLISTAHIAGTIRSLQEGFFNWRPKTPESYFNSKAIPLNLANKSLYGANMVLGDGLMIYRVWIIYQRSWLIVALPILLTMATGSLIAVTIWEFSNLKPGQSAFVMRVKDIAPALFSVPLVTNLVITGLLIWRIKQAQNTTKFTSNKKLYAFYQRVIRNTIESCILYPLVLLITLILYCLNNNAQDILTGSMAQVVSIVPTLMWLQHCLGQSTLGNMETTTRLPTQKTIEFSPNRDLRSTKLDATVAESLTDMEAAEGGICTKEGSSTLGSKELLHDQ